MSGRKYHEIEIRTYDVWGNEEDGWEVNNVFKLDTGELIVNETVWENDYELIQIVKGELDLLDLDDDGFEIDGDTTLYVNHKGYPLCEIAVVRTIVDMEAGHVPIY